jgi:transposase InsO family protein
MVLSYSRAVFALFTLDQTLESFLRGHVDAFAAWSGVPRMLVYDTLRSPVLERAGSAIRFHPRLLELAGHYHFAPRPCTPGRGNENAFVESFIGKFRDECLNEQWFVSVAEVQAVIEAWRVDYNTVRPHSLLVGDTPAHFALITEEVARRRIAPRSYETQNGNQKPEDLSLSM